MAIDKRPVSIWPIALTGIFILSIALYVPSLMGGAIWDDGDLISGRGFGSNSLHDAFTHPFLAHYFRPLTSASFVVDSSFAGQTPFFYHQTNILIHALTAVLVSCLAILVTKRKSAGVLAGLFFATQPLQVGATAWIGGRTDVLSAFFVAAFMTTLIQYHAKSKPVWLGAAILAYFLASISKEQAMLVLPAAPLSVFAFGTGKWKDTRRITLPFLAVVALLIVMWVIDAPAPYRPHDAVLDLVPRALRTAAHYGLAWLTPNRPSILTFTLENYRSALWVPVGGAIVAGSVCFLVWAWKRHRPAAWVSTCGLLVYIPISNFPRVPSFVVGPYRCAESGVAVACLFGVVCAFAIASRRYALSLAMAANLVAGVAVTWWGIQQWSTPLSLFRTVAEIDPHFINGLGNYAHALEMDDRPQEELALIDRTLTWVFGTPNWKELLATKRLAAFTPDVAKRLDTNGAGGLDERTLGWFVSLDASGLARLHCNSEAVAVEKDALMIAPKDPTIHFAYGWMLIKTDRHEAIHQWETALKLAPKYGACAVALANERIVDGRFAEAVALLNPVLPKLGWDSTTWIELAKAKIGLHNLAGAREALMNGEKSIFVRQAEIDALKKQIQEMERVRKGSHA